MRESEKRNAVFSKMLCRVLFRVMVVGMVLSGLGGCRLNNPFLRGMARGTPNRKERRQALESLKERADRFYQRGEYRKALLDYKKALVLNPDDSEVQFRIREIRHWIPLIKQRERSIKNRFREIEKRRSRKVSETLEKKRVIEEKLRDLENDLNAARQKSKAAEIMNRASLALSDRDFQKARFLTRKVLVADPDSRIARDFLDRIAEAQEEWQLVEKLKKTLKSAPPPPVPEIPAVSPAESPAPGKRESAPSEESVPSSEEPGSSEESAASEKTADDAGMRIGTAPVPSTPEPVSPASDIEKIVRKEFPFEGVLSRSRGVKTVERDFLWEQTFDIYEKAIAEYKRDRTDGKLERFPEQELKRYRAGIARAYFWLGRYYEHEEKPGSALEHYGTLVSQFDDSELVHLALYRAAMLHLGLEEEEEAKKALELLLDKPPNPPIETQGDGPGGEPGENRDHDTLVKEAYKALARIQIDRGHFEIALSLYQDILERFPDDEAIRDEVTFLKGGAYVESGDYEEAYDVFDSLVQKGRRSEQYERALYRRAMTLCEMKRYDRCRRELEAIFLHDPLNSMKVRALFSHAETFHSEKEYSRAIVHLQKALESNPGYEERPWALVLLGDAYIKTGLFEEAVQVLDEVARQNRNLAIVPRAMYLLGKAYYRLSRYPEARKVLIEAGRRFPDDPFARRGRFLLGDVDFADKKYLAAEKQYRIAFVNHPEGLLAFRSRLKRARCLRRAGKFELLEKYFRESFEGDDLGRAEWDVEDNSERARYREIYYKMLFEYGDFLMELKKYGEAVPIFKRVVAEYPEGEDRLWSRYMVGKAYELDNQTDRAIEQYRKIVNENARGFWAEQAQFNLNTLLWESRYNEQAMKVGGTYPEQ